MTEELRLETERLVGRVPEESMAALVLDFYTRNRDFLEPYEPERPPEFYTLEEQRRLLRQARTDREEGRGCSFWLFRKGEPERAIGYTALNNIVRGAFQSCFLGCKMDGTEINQGYMTGAVRACAELAFRRLGLHRIEGNIMPPATAPPSGWRRNAAFRKREWPGPICAFTGSGRITSTWSGWPTIRPEPGTAKNFCKKKDFHAGKRI